VPARRLPSWAWVTGLTAGAIAAVVVLTAQAENGPHPTASAAKRPNASASASAKPPASPKPSASPQAAGVPAKSGAGRRVVYSLGQHRVWLVDADDTARRSFTVWPGTVNPAVGSYTLHVFEIGLNAWLTKHIRLTGNYVLNYMGGDADNVKKGFYFQKPEHELLFRAAVQL